MSSNNDTTAIPVDHITDVMETKKNLSTELKIEEFAKELGLQLRLILLEKTSTKLTSLDKIVKPIAASKIPKNIEVK